jgi:hypothetical protein
MTVIAAAVFTVKFTRWTYRLHLGHPLRMRLVWGLLAVACSALATVADPGSIPWKPSPLAVLVCERVCMMLALVVLYLAAIEWAAIKHQP